VGLDEVVDEFSGDALRLYELFIGPSSASVPWNMDGMEGVSRFLARLWRLLIDEESGKPAARIVDLPDDRAPALNQLLHKTIQGVTESVESIDKLNTAVSRMMEFLNTATRSEILPRPIIKTYLRLLAPFAPHIAEELWERLGESAFIARAAWPEYDPALLLDAVIEIPVQVNGRLRTVLRVDRDVEKQMLEQRVLADPTVARYVEGKSIQRIIIVPERLVNVIVK
jgi:leucyl-tRNA synthetase